MFHPASQIRYIDDSIGHGVFATQFIPQGTITWAHDLLDKELTPQEMQQLPQPVHEMALTYSYRNAKGNYILCWDLTRYINHNFQPNTMITPYGFEIAITDIEPGDQIFNDYGTLNIIEPFRPDESSQLRHTVYPNDIQNHYLYFDSLISSAIHCLLQVDQPLKPLIKAENWDEVTQVITEQKPARSILECLFIPNK